MTQSNFQGFYTTDIPQGGEGGECEGCEHYDGKYCLFFYHNFDDGKPIIPQRTKGGWCEFYESNTDS